MRYNVVCFLSFVLLQAATANDRKFTYTYETSVLPAGAREIEIGNTFRTDRGYYYRALDQRIEFEFGVTDNLMSALYLNSRWRLQDSNGSLPGGYANANQEISVSSEWKYKLLDRSADPVGLSLYGEATLGLDEVELEGKLLIDKQMDDILFAFNAVAEHEWESELEDGITHSEKELLLEFDAGLSYQATHAFSFGAEVRNHNEIKEGTWEHSALFAGPVVSYTAANWWATFTLLPQVTSFKGATNGNLVLNQLEKVEARLLFSFHL